ncbi:MAG: proton-conducting transporter membrane subunit [Candidatus Omnitrophica bacterium]|nr:proton-conducting transporter membrane subunit [Candidatus Omnitrophota bacterium]
MLSLFISIPFLSLIVFNLPGKNSGRVALSWSAILFLAQAVLALLFSINAINPVAMQLSRIFVFKLAMDPLSLLVLLSIGIVAFTALLAGNSLISEKTEKHNFINLLMVAVTGMNATCLAADLFSAYVFIEIVAVSSFVLIALQKDRLALEGSFKYIIMSSIATVLMLTSIALIILTCGDTDFGAIASGLAAQSGNPLVKLAVGLFLCGLFIKSGLVPFHGWLPDAYSAAPSAVSILLAGIITKVTGVYVLMRLVISVFGMNPQIQNLLMLFGTISIIFGALAALTQHDFKRMLAYSSISQVGYIILGLGCGTPLAIAGAAFHFFNHAIFKSLLFVNAAAVEKQAGTIHMDSLGGLSAKMPVTGTTSVIALLSTAGIPPLAGFWSKLIIIMALWSAGKFAYAYIAVIFSVVTLAYFLSMQRRVFFGKLQTGLEAVQEAGLGLTIPSALLAAITIAAGVCFPWVLDKLILPIQTILR